MTNPAPSFSALAKKLGALAGALRKDRLGVTALEYGIIASILGITLVTIFKGFGSTLGRLFSSVGTSI